MVFDESLKRTVLYGGQQIVSGGGAMLPLTDTWTWNGTNWEEVKTTANPGTAAVRSASMTYDAARQVVLLWNTWNSATWIFDGNSWIKLDPPNNPPVQTNILMGFDKANSQVPHFSFRNFTLKATSNSWPSTVAPSSISLAPVSSDCENHLITKRLKSPGDSTLLAL
jgi:hypothetical protein